MAQNRRKRRRPSGPSGIVDERRLTGFLGQQNVRFATSQMLDHVHKIDELLKRKEAEIMEV